MNEGPRAAISPPRNLGGRCVFFRFIVVGALNTAFGYSCFALLLWAGLHYALALLLATVAGIFFNFFSIGRVVFESKNNRLLGRFVLVYGMIYIINVVGLRLLASVGLNAYVGGAVLLLPVAVLSYFLNKKFVFYHG